MGTDARLFVGLELTEEARRALAEFRCELKGKVSGKLSHPALYHLTLCFLGQVPREKIPELCALMDEVEIRPFTLTLGKPGTFKNGSVLWVGIQEPCAELYALQQALKKALNAAGFPVEAGAYRPHITLGRQIKGAFEPLEPPSAAFTVSFITLFESTRIEGRLSYQPLYRSGNASII